MVLIYVYVYLVCYVFVVWFVFVDFGDCGVKYICVVLVCSGIYVYMVGRCC